MVARSREATTSPVRPQRASSVVCDGRARVLRCFAGFRPYVADGKPIVGRSGIVENLLVAAGHEGDGICLSPITGVLITDLATGKKPAFDIVELSPDRFGKTKEEREAATGLETVEQ